MSKGSLFFGNARGKLGQVVLSTVKGQQIARAWQPKVANPRTTSQQIQRAKFANTVKFYRRATSNLFKFAFEDKKKTESDYNAFMRHNVDVATIVKRSYYDNIYYPAIGFNWLMSYGSLGDLTPVTNGNSGDTTFLRDVPIEGTTEGANITIAQVSQAFVDNRKAVNGDYVTFVTIKSSLANADDIPSSAPQWSITQIKIDTNNTSDKFLSVLQSQDPNMGVSFLQSDNNNFIAVKATGAAWFAAIHSRVTTGGVLVSTSRLSGNMKAFLIVEEYDQPSYKDAALVSWERQTSPILKGSIVQDK